MVFGLIRESSSNAGTWFAERKVPLVIVPSTGVGYLAARAYRRAKGPKLTGLLPKGIRSKVKCDELVTISNWSNQPRALISRVNFVLVIGLSVGTMAEICLTKWYKNVRVVVLLNCVSTFPAEITRDLNLSSYDSWQNFKLYAPEIVKLGE